MDETRCERGLDPRECPVALGIWVEGIRWNEDGTGDAVRKWRRVCDEVAGACAAAVGEVER